MRLIFDARQETLYPLGKEGFSGGSQVYIKAITNGLAERGHTVHVVTNDLEHEEQRGPNLWYWGPQMHPTVADCAIMQMHVNANCDYDAPILILMTSCVDPYLGPNNEWGKQIDAYPVFSQVHKDLLLKTRPTVPEGRVYITGLGVDLKDYQQVPVQVDRTHPQIVKEEKEGIRKHIKVNGRMLYANDPARGLFYTMDVFDIVHDSIPEATLHIAYDFDTQLSWRQWEHSQMAQMLLDCKRRMSMPGIVNLGALTREQIIREQLECQVHCYPADPPGVGTQTHGLSQVECAAAGAALVLSDIEAFPEIFGDGATILPTIGTFLPEQQRRVDAYDYAQVVIELMKSPEKWQEESRRARVLAERYSWTKVIDAWESMIESLRAVQVG